MEIKLTHSEWNRVFIVGLVCGGVAYALMSDYLRNETHARLTALEAIHAEAGDE